MNEKTKDQIIRKIRPYLENYRNGFTLEIVPEGIRRIDDWWRIPVRPSIQPQRLYDYYAALAEIELNIDENENLNVVLTTSEPGEPLSQSDFA